jgi:hypothetical protein
VLQLVVLVLRQLELLRELHLLADLQMPVLLE